MTIKELKERLRQLGKERDDYLIIINDHAGGGYDMGEIEIIEGKFDREDMIEFK